MMTAFTTTCLHCNDLLWVAAKAEDFAKWEGGMKVQDAFPYLSNGDREIIISRTCEKCWDEMFGDWE